MSEGPGGVRDKLLYLIDKLDDKNMTIVELLLEIARLRSLLRANGIDYNRRSKP